MEVPKQKVREHWSSAITFVLAAAGSAVGLGNIWKFPYEVGKHGGGAFLLIFLVCILVLGFPLMLCELVLGRATQKAPIGAFRKLNNTGGKLSHGIVITFVLMGLLLSAFNSWGLGLLFILIGALIFKFHWSLLGVLCLTSGFLILSFYGVVGGWIINYCYYSAMDFFATNSESMFSSSQTASTLFDNLSYGALNPTTHTRSFPWESLFGQLLFMGSVVLTIYAGIKSGIEKWSRILMPLIFIVLGVLIIRGLSLPGAIEGIQEFVTPDFSHITPKTILVALGHAFFSLSLGMGCMLTYASYAKKSENLFKISAWIVILDTIVSLLACFAIFPFVFAMGLQPDVGPGLIFNVLPQAFHKMGATGPFWAILFFGFIFFAALTSAMSLLECLVATAIEELNWNRKKATLIVSALVTGFGFFSVLSIHNWDRLTRIHESLVFLFNPQANSFFELIESLTSNYCMPLGGLLICLFVGWVWTPKKAIRHLHFGGGKLLDKPIISALSGVDQGRITANTLTLIKLWAIMVRWILPIIVLIILLNEAGWIKAS